MIAIEFVSSRLLRDHFQRKLIKLKCVNVFKMKKNPNIFEVFIIFDVENSNPTQAAVQQLLMDSCQLF